MRIILTGGGTGGHIFPLVAIARKLSIEAKKQGVVADVLFVGPAREAKIFEQEKNIATRRIITGKLRRYFSLYTLIDMPKILIGLLQSYFVLLFYMPDVIFSKGGYAAFPVLVIGWLFRVPIIMHESDSVAGLTNRMLARFASHIVISFPANHPEFSKDKIVQLGNPVRDLRGGVSAFSSREFHITTQKPILLIIGGSQGARQINQLVLSQKKELSSRYEIIHQTGAKHYKQVSQEIKSLPRPQQISWHPTPFLNEESLKNAYAAADLIISRAGASSIFEIALVGKPSILIPLPTSAAGHQEKNGILYEGRGACIAADPRNIDGHILVKEIDDIIRSKKKIIHMKQAALAFAKPAAATDIARLILKNN